MKRLNTTIILFMMALLTLQAQGQPGFRLYFANNVADVADFHEITSPTSGLNWRQVQDGDMSGNGYEADQVEQMLASTRMKGLADQQLFWNMRNHALLCFRIEDDDNTTSSYEVVVTEKDSQRQMSITVTKFFFVNVPLLSSPSTEYDITVTKVADTQQRIRFKYTAYDWNNSRLYIFQLDRRRQIDNKDYEMEYVTGFMDEDGYMNNDTTRLQLKAKAFQSFFVPEGSDLLDVVLIGDENKLRIKKERLHTGINDLEDRLSKMALSPTFYLDKHDGREFVNFNWLGSGLFEKYDTLFLTLYDQRAVPVKSATIHIEQVDENGHPTHSKQVKYLGYDAKRGVHKLLTMGKPAYIEILASGKLPTVYKYAGAADEQTGFVNEDRCSAILTLQTGRWSEDDMTVSSLIFRNLKDERFIIVRNKIDHRLCTVEEMNLTGRQAADTISYLVDCGHSFPKLLNNNPIERFAELETTFSRPSDGVAPTSSLICKDIATGQERRAEEKEIVVASARDFYTFSRDYYFVRYDLTSAITKGEVARLQLQAGDMSYEKLPLLCSSSYDRDEALQMAGDYANDNCTGEPDPKSESRSWLHRAFHAAARGLNSTLDMPSDGTNIRDGGMGDGFADFGCDLKLPIQFKFNIRPMTIQTSVNYDFIKQILSLQTNIEFNRQDDPREGESSTVSDARKELREAENSDRIQLGSDKATLNVAGEDVDPDRWINEDINDIFDMSANHVGKGWFGGLTLTLSTPIKNWKKFQVTEAAGQIGYGYGANWGNLAHDPKLAKLKSLMDKAEEILPISLQASFETNIQADLGVRSFDDDFEESMSGYNMGYFFQVGAKLKAGLTAEIGTPDKFWGTDLPWAAVLNAKLGVRFGGKLGGFFRVEGPFAPEWPGVGGRLVGVLVGQAYFNFKAFVFHFSASAGFRVGGQLLIPDSDFNPFHADFPYWLKKGSVRALGRSYRRLAAPAPGEFGRLLVSDVASDANPHFLGGNQIVYNDLKTPTDYNDDQVTMLDLPSGKTTSLSPVSTDPAAQEGAATNHMRSKRGNHDVVVYEQMNCIVESDKVSDSTALSTNVEALKHSRIRAAFREGDGEWKQTIITADDKDNEGFSDLKPVVSIQSNGNAAVVYQHGKFMLVDENVSADSLYNLTFKGQLMLRTYDGNNWSEATPLFNIDDRNFLSRYDLVMRGDTALVAAIVRSEDMEHGALRYASKSMHDDKVNYRDDELLASDFFMLRVGSNSVIAMTYAASDSIRDIYVKTVNMDGTNDGHAGCDIGLENSHPMKVKIICDRQAENLNDFAVMWTEVNNIRQLEDGTTALDSMRTVLNAARIHLSNALQPTAPITLGSEVDSVLVMTDFDGFLDDDSIKVVYTLSNIDTGAGIIMQNAKAFTNSFEHEVSFSRESLRGSSTLPVNILIRNTGTSSIQAVEAVINGELFRFDEGYVAPRKSRTFTVQYPIESNFDGYVTSAVSVEYDNVFRARQNTIRNGVKRNLLRQSSQSSKSRIVMSDIDSRVISQSIENGANTFVVEVTDNMGLFSDMAVRVGIYAHPNSREPLSDGAEVVIEPSDFIRLADSRKAYATVTVEGITEPVQAYLNAHVVDTGQRDPKDALVANSRAGIHATLVNLFPTDVVTDIRRPSPEESALGHRVAVATSDDGVTLSGLQTGEHVRIFAPDGTTVYSRHAKSATLFVPLHRHSVYLLSAGEEIFKFQF